MPDITMCLTRTCLKKEECYRYKAKPDRYQSYANFTELCAKEIENSEYFMPVARRTEYENHFS